jgi:hypothetical protein
MTQGGHHGIRDHMPGLMVGEQFDHLLGHVEAMIKQRGLGQNPIGVLLPGRFHIALDIDHRRALPFTVEQANNLQAHRPLPGCLVEKGPGPQLAGKGAGAWMHQLNLLDAFSNHLLVPPEVGQLRDMLHPLYPGGGFGPDPPLREGAQRHLLQERGFLLLTPQHQDAGNADQHQRTPQADRRPDAQHQPLFGLLFDDRLPGQIRKDHLEPALSRRRRSPPCRCRSR